MSHGYANGYANHIVTFADKERQLREVCLRLQNLAMTTESQEIRELVEIVYALANLVEP